MLLAGRKVRTLDDTLQVFQDRDLNSAVVGNFPKDVEIQLGGVSEIEGREWLEATLPNGTTGYLVSASARSHTEIGDGPLDFDRNPLMFRRDFAWRYRKTSWCPRLRTIRPCRFPVQQARPRVRLWRLSVGQYSS